MSLRVSSRGTAIPVFSIKPSKKETGRKCGIGVGIGVVRYGGSLPQSIAALN